MNGEGMKGKSMNREGMKGKSMNRVGREDVLVLILERPIPERPFLT